MLTSISDQYIRQQTDDGPRTTCLTCGSFYTATNPGGSIEGWERQHKCS